MQNKAWNQYSSSSDSDVEDNDNDSWFDDDKQQNSKTQQNATSTEQKDNPTKVEESKAQTINQETKIQKGENKTDENQKRYEKRKFPTDEQLLNLYESKQVDNTKAIKAAKVKSEQTKQIIKDTKTRKTVELAEDAFILFFETEEDLINFIKQKMQKRSRFFLQQFFETKTKQLEREEKYKNREQNNQRKPRRDRPQEYPKDENKRDRPERKERVDNPVEQKRQRPKKRYEKQEDSDKQEKKQTKTYDQKKQPKKNTEKQEEKTKKVYLLKEYFQIPQKSNSLTITSDKFDINRILQELEKKRVLKDFAKFYIEAPFYTLKKVALLCSQIGSKKKFYLQKEPPQEGQKDTIVKLTMIQNLKKHQTDTFVQRYKPKVQPKQSHIRLLGEKTQEYFKNIDKYNLSEILKGFDENKYITQLRESSQDIQKQWNCWKIQAEEDNIELLLRLANRIKKSTIYDVQLKPSLRNQKALLTAELKQRPQKERRPKVDVSNVNNYLS